MLFQIGFDNSFFIIKKMVTQADGIKYIHKNNFRQHRLISTISFNTKKTIHGTSVLSIL